MLKAIVPNTPNEFEAHLTPTEMAEYNDYLDSIKVGTRDPLPEDFINKYAPDEMATVDEIDEMPFAVDEMCR